MVPIILAALRAHHTPTWMLRKGTACIRLGLSAGQWHVNCFYLRDRLSTPYTHNKDFCGHACKCASVLFNVYSQRTSHVCCSFFSDNPFEICSPVHVMLISEKLELGKPTYTFSRTIFVGLIPSIVFGSKPHPVRVNTTSCSRTTVYLCWEQLVRLGCCEISSMCVTNKAFNWSCVTEQFVCKTTGSMS
jgi:hypothetical protein